MYQILFVLTLAFCTQAQSGCANCELELAQCQQDESNAIQRGSYTSSISLRCQRIAVRCVQCRQQRENQQREQYIQKQRESSQKIAKLNYQMNENGTQFILSLNKEESVVYNKVVNYVNVMDSVVTANCYKNMTAQMMSNVNPYDPYDPSYLMDPTYSDPYAMSQKATSCVVSTFMTVANTQQGMNHLMGLLKIQEKHRHIAHNSLVYTLSAKYGF